MKIYLIAFMVLLFQHGYSQIHRYRAVQVDSAYLDGYKEVPAHFSYPNFLVTMDLDKERITIYQRPKDVIYELSDWSEVTKKPDSVQAIFRLRALDNRNEICNVNIYRYKNCKYDYDYHFLYHDKIVVLHLKEIE